MVNAPDPGQRTGVPEGRNGRRSADLRYLAAFLVAIVVLNILSSYWFTRIDFTAEKRYTLTELTRKQLAALDDDVQITVYLEGEFPAGFKRLRSATRDLLADYRSYSGGKLDVAFVNPFSGTQESQEKAYADLLEKGLEPTNLSVKTEEGLSQKMVFPAALVTYQGRQMPVSLLQKRSGADPEEVLNNSIQNLEYAFTSALKKISSGGKPRVGFTEGHGELNDLQLSDAIKSLEAGFEPGRVDLATIPFEGLDKISLLVVPKPESAFTEAEKFKVDYFLQKGGRIFWAVDNVSAELDSLRGMGEQLVFPKKLNLDDMFFRYGVRINYELIADMNCAQIPLSVGNVGGQAQIQLVPWLFYPVFMPVSAHPVVKNLDGVRSEFANTIDTIAVPGLKKEIILASSPFSRSLAAPTMISLQMVEQEPDPRAFRSVPKASGVILEGRFPSNFRNRPVPEGIGQAALPAEAKAAKMVVVADGDVLKNQVSTTDGSPFPLGYDRYSQQQYGNRSFFLNVVDYLTDDSGIIGLRNKELKLRLLDRARIRTEKTLWQLVNIAGPLVILGLFAVLSTYLRRKRYT
jgi:ABC-2 type transport system permease protein